MTYSYRAYTFSRFFPIFFSQRATSSLKDWVFARSIKYKVLFKVLGSYIYLIVNVPTSSSFTYTTTLHSRIIQTKPRREILVQREILRWTLEDVNIITMIIVSIIHIRECWRDLEHNFKLQISRMGRVYLAKRNN